MQMAVLVVLTGALCVEGGVSDLPHKIEVPSGFRAFLRQLVEQTHCGLCSSMNVYTLGELLERLLPRRTLKGFLYFAGVDKPNKNDPYPNRGGLLKLILASPRQRNILWNQTIVLLQLDPLQWPRSYLIGPSIRVRDDVDPLKLEVPCYVWKELNIVSGKSFKHQSSSVV